MQSLAGNGDIPSIVRISSRNTTKSRSLSAYPIGALFQRPMVNTRKSNFTKESSLSTIEDGRILGFTVGPCYLLQRQKRPNSSKASLTLEDIIVPIREIDFIQKEDVDNGQLKVTSTLSFANLDASMCSTECDVQNQECGVDVDVRKLSFNQKILSKRNDKHRASQIKSRKSKQKSARSLSKHTPSLKNKSNRGYYDFSSKRNQQVKHSSKIGTKPKSYQIFVTSNDLQPVLDTSLPNIKAKNGFPPCGLHNFSLQTKSCCLPDALKKASAMEKPSNHMSKIYLSQRQSQNLMGIPAVPPCTPYHDEACQVEFIPSLSDIKSQRFVIERLSHIWQKQSKKEHDEKVAKEQKRLREEKIKQKDLLSNIKRQQRAEIYALNAILSGIEKSNYEKFKEETGLPV